jgi:hypothetical protein
VPTRRLEQVWITSDDKAILVELLEKAKAERKRQVVMAEIVTEVMRKAGLR